MDRYQIATASVPLVVRMQVSANFQQFCRYRKRTACGRMQVTANISNNFVFLRNEPQLQIPQSRRFIFYKLCNGILVDVFVRRIYFECIVENLNYCAKEKGMEIYAWCIMPSHIHLVFKSTNQKPEELIRDFKSYTSKKLIALIEANVQESRREWLLNSFKKAGAANSNNAQNQFWQQHSHPTELWSANVIQQKWIIHTITLWKPALWKMIMNTYIAAREIIAVLRDWLILL